MTYRESVAINYQEKPQFDLVIDDITAAVADKIEIVSAEGIQSYVDEASANIQASLEAQLAEQHTLILELQGVIFNLQNPP